MPDDEWMQIVGPRHWIVLSQDRKWHINEAEIAAIRLYNIKCFYLPCNPFDRWDLLCLFIAKHKKISQLANDKEGPFIYEIGANGRFRKINI
jgi:hypothetical protein